MPKLEPPDDGDRDKHDLQDGRSRGMKQHPREGRICDGSTHDERESIDQHARPSHVASIRSLIATGAGRAC